MVLTYLTLLNRSTAVFGFSAPSSRIYCFFFGDNWAIVSFGRNVDTLPEISRVLAGLSDPQLIAAFLRDILTPREQHDISTRWELVKRLDRGESQRQIAADLGLSLCKITRGSRELKKTDSAFKKVIRLSLGKAGRGRVGSP